MSIIIIVYASLVLVAIFLLAWLLGRKKDNQNELSNKFSERLATTFLFLVGMEYIFIGFLAVVGLGIIAGVLGALYVAPQQIVDLGSKASGSWGVDQTIASILGFISILGGIIGIYGVKEIRHNKKIGYKIWLVLVLVSIIVALWNVIYTFSPFFFLWPVVYSLVLYRVWKSSYKNAT